MTVIRTRCRQAAGNSATFNRSPKIPELLDTGLLFGQGLILKQVWPSYHLYQEEVELWFSSPVSITNHWRTKSSPKPPTFFGGEHSDTVNSERLPTWIRILLLRVFIVCSQLICITGTKVNSVTPWLYNNTFPFRPSGPWKEVKATWTTSKQVVGLMLWTHWVLCD